MEDRLRPLRPVLRPARTAWRAAERRDHRLSHRGTGTRLRLPARNAVGDGTVQDIRLPVFGELVPFCYLKYRPVANRFANVNSRVELSTTDSVISEDELARFRRFCRAMRNEDARRGIRGRFWQPHEIGGREGCGPASRTLLGQ